MKKGQGWTEQQLSYMKEHYPTERAEDVGLAIGKSKSAVQKKAFNLGIVKDKEGFHDIRSKACSGVNSGNFKGYRCKTKKGYIIRYLPNHPNATKSGYVMEHRIVMEEHLGIILPKGFSVHHINGQKDDNRIENLAVMTNGAHSTYHNKTDGKQKHGEENPLYKKVDLQSIDDMKNEGYSVKEICKRLGIKKTKYYNVLKGA